LITQVGFLSTSYYFLLSTSIEAESKQRTERITVEQGSTWVAYEQNKKAWVATQYQNKKAWVAYEHFTMHHDREISSANTMSVSDITAADTSPARNH
jgi:hypothetical protein